MGEMEHAKLGDICQFKAGNAFKKEFQGRAKGDYPFIKVSDMNLSGNEISIARSENWVDQEDVAEHRYKVHEVGSVVFAKIGIALTYNRRRKLCQPTIIDNNMMAAMPNRNQVNERYFYYLLSTLDFNEIASGSALPYLTQKDLQGIDISIHKMPEQILVASLLGALDDKIELNRRANGTLEAMARAIFKDWFVDFGPTRAKAEGLEPYLAPDLWDLFPNALDDEDKPVGWFQSKLGNEISVLETGKRPRGGVAGILEGIPSVGAESIVRVGEFDFSKTKYVPLEFYSNMRKGHVSDGDVLIYKDGGKPGELRPAVTYVSKQFPFTKFCINEHVFRIRTESLSQPLLYCVLSTDDIFWQMRERATGVAQPGLNQGAVKSIDFTMPDDNRLLSAAAALINPAIDGCNENSFHSRTLAQTRDLLLPKLISGEICLRDAEKAVEAIA